MAESFWSDITGLKQLYHYLVVDLEQSFYPLSKPHFLNYKLGIVNK